MKKDRYIKIEAIDPTGVVLDKSRKLDYYHIGYEGENQTPPEELEYEPMRKFRYFLTIGEYLYHVSREGEILGTVVEPNKK
jgi:hypothetical protein